MTIPTMSLQILILRFGRKWGDSLKDLLCNDGSHLEAKGICADGSFPLIIRANPVPLAEEFVNELYPATINIKLG